MSMKAKAAILVSSFAVLLFMVVGGLGGAGSYGGGGGWARGGALYNKSGSVYGSNCVFSANQANAGFKGNPRKDGYRGWSRGGAVSEELFDRGICLPSGSSLTREQQARVTAQMFGISFSDG